MLDDEMLELEPEAEAGGGMDPTKIADLLRSLAEQISQLQQMFPADAGEEVATDIDEATEVAAEEQAINEEPIEAAPAAGATEEEEDEEKLAAKSRAASLIARSMR